MEREDDVQLIHDVLSGDDAAFGILVEKYQKSVHALAWRKIGDFHYAEEITQDTFLRAYQKLSTLKNPNLFAGWLYVIANRICLNWIRQQNPTIQSLEDTSVKELEKSAYTRYVSEQHETQAIEHRYEIVEKLLGKLPESERTVVTLHYLGEMTAKEIGRFLGVSVKTIHSRLHRARKRLQAKEELLVHEVLGGVQIPTSLSQNIMRQIADMKPTPTPTPKPLLPWLAFGTAAVLILLLLGISNRYLARFQKPYSFEAASEPTIEIIEAPVVLETDAKPAPRSQVGQATTTGKISSAGLHGSETVSTPGAPVHPEDTEAWMPDSALRAAIREELALPAVMPLTQENMLQLHRLNAGGKGITNLKGLEFARNLVDLHLGDEGNYVIDLRPLATLTSLINLNVGGNQVADLRPLANLTHLTGLSLWNNQVTNVSSLRSLTALTYLNLADNHVSDLSPIANLINLEKLDLFDNEIQNVAPLADLKSLKHLILTENHIQDFTPLAGLMSLQALWIKGNPIKDLKPLSELNLTDLKYDAVADPTAQTQPSEAWMPDPALRAVVRGEIGLLPEAPFTKEKLLRLDYLDAHDNGILDITGLEFATNLRELRLSQNPITDLRPLANLTKLEGLHIGDVSPSAVNLDLHLLTNLINLEMLSLQRNGILDISPISGLTELRVLSIEGNPVTDLSPLARLNLRELDISNNPLTDLRQLASLTSLEYLCLENSRISDIRPLAGLKKLRILDIRYNDIEDISPVASVTTLRTLWIKGNPITDLSPLSELNLTDLTYDIVEQTIEQTDPAVAWMPNTALRTAVRGELGLLPDVPFAKEKMPQLQALSVSDKRINNISGLEFATNLRELDLNKNPITDLRPLANLTKLERLNLSEVSPNTPYLDLRPLANLINLKNLSLENSRISDISPLAGLKRLYILDIRYNAIENIHPLAGLIALRKLLIQGNSIRDLRPLSGLTLTDFDYDEVYEVPPVGTSRQP